MKIRPRYVAAALYGSLAIFLVRSWILPSYGNDGVLSLRFIRWALSAENQNRDWYVWFAAATISAPMLATLFVWHRASLRPLAGLLVLAAALYLAVSLWQFDAKIIWLAGAAFVCALLHGWHTSKNPHT